MPLTKSIIVIEKRVSNVGMLYIMQMYAESNATSYICLGLRICTLINPSVGDVIYFLDRLHHHLLGLVSVQIPACDRYRKSRYSPHTSDVQHAYVRYFLLYHYTLNLTIQAYTRNYTYPRYAWILYAWYADEWWTEDAGTDCTSSQLAKFLENVIAIRIFAVPTDKNAMTDTGLVGVCPT